MALKYPFYRLRGSEIFHFPLVYKMKTNELFEKNQLNLVFVCTFGFGIPVTMGKRLWDIKQLYWL